MTKHRYHILGVPHTQTHPDWSGCAFQARVMKFLEMYANTEHEVFHYGHADSQIPQAPNIHHVIVTDNNSFLKAYGQEYLDGAWRTKGFAHYFNTNDECYADFNANTLKEIDKRKQPNDFIFLTFGYGHKVIHDMFPGLIRVETNIGYPAAFADYRIYESHAIRNAMSGPEAIARCNQNWYQRVIPNFFLEQDFEYREQKSDYILYLGRIGTNKGVDIAIDATKRAGKRLVIAGQGSLTDLGYTKTPDHVELVGYADPALRKELLANAQALFVASRYLEPFGGVQCEAWLSGTPTITSPWGAFAEYGNEQVGFQCWTMKDFVDAINNAPTLDPKVIRKHGEKFLMPTVKPKYDRYFEDLYNVYTGQGWYHGI